MGAPHEDESATVPPGSALCDTWLLLEGRRSLSRADPCSSPAESSLPGSA